MKKTILIFIFTLTLCATALAQSNFTDNTFVITTYYPAPYGVYRNMRLYPSNEPTAGVDRGVMYYDDTQNVMKYLRNDSVWVNMTGGGYTESGLNVNGNITATGDICLASGVCLSSILSITCGDCGIKNPNGSCSPKSAGDNNLPACQKCDGSSLTHVNVAAGTQDTEGSYTCSAAHYRCDDSGGCALAPIGQLCGACLFTGKTCADCTVAGCKVGSCGDGLGGGGGAGTVSVTCDATHPFCAGNRPLCTCMGYAY